MWAPLADGGFVNLSKVTRLSPALVSAPNYIVRAYVSDVSVDLAGTYASKAEATSRIKELISNTED